MTSFRILYVDDDRDLRRLVEMSLGSDGAFAVRSCSSGEEALAAAAEWSPHLILCDIMMPGMDGPATLARLRESPATSDIPVIFITARAQPQELERFKALGAAGVITKPFRAKELRSSVRSCLQVVGSESTRSQVEPAEADEERDAFRSRLRTDAVTLAALRATLRDDPTSSRCLQELETVAHKLAGSAALFGFQEVSRAASELEASVLQIRSGRLRASFEAEFDGLIECAERHGRVTMATPAP